MQNVQVNQNVNAANFLLVSSRAGNSISVDTESDNSINFADVLQSTNEQQKSSGSVTYTDTKSDTRFSLENQSQQDDVSISSEEMVSDEKAEVLGTKSVDSEPEKTAEESAKVQVNEDVEEMSEEDKAIILEEIGSLLADVMQQFGISLEELAVKLEEFGMEPADLLTQQGLKEFFLQMNHAEVSDLIVDENLNQELQTFLAEVSDELDTLDTLIPDMETFTSDKEIARMLSDLVVSQEEVIVAQPAIEPEQEVSFWDEPEVVVKNDKSEIVHNTSKNDDTYDSSESNSRQLSESPHQDTAHESVPMKQNTFTNPILQAIQNAMNNVEVVSVSEQPMQQTDILRQVVEQVRVNMNQQQTSLELQLYPEHLGRIQINVVAKEGVMTASIVAETEVAKQAIEAGLLNLKEAMEQQELKVEAIEVMVSTTAFENEGGQEQTFNEKSSSNPRRKIDISELNEDIPVEDEAEVEKMKASGSSVSYRA